MKWLPLFVLAGCAGSAASHRSRSESQRLPFIENDFARATTEAKKTGRPLFVETWAPW
jgi:hypothetical protein